MVNIVDDIFDDFICDSNFFKIGILLNDIKVLLIIIDWNIIVIIGNNEIYGGEIMIGDLNIIFN